MITDAQYQEAKKKMASLKSKENFLKVTLNYDNILVFPYKEGIQFVEAMATVQRIGSDYGKNKRLVPIDESKISFEVFSPEEMHRHQMAALLNVGVDDIPKEYT